MDIVEELNEKYTSAIASKVFGEAVPKVKLDGISALLDQYFMDRLKQLVDHSKRYGVDKETFLGCEGTD